MSFVIASSLQRPSSNSNTAATSFRRKIPWHSVFIATIQNTIIPPTTSKQLSVELTRRLTCSNHSRCRDCRAKSPPSSSAPALRKCSGTLVEIEHARAGSAAPGTQRHLRASKLADGVFPANITRMLPSRCHSISPQRSLFWRGVVVRQMQQIALARSTQLIRS